MKLILASHSTLSKAMLETVEMFLGKQEDVSAMGVFPGDSPEDFEDSLREITDHLKPEEECLVLCDIISGTPFNVSSRISCNNDKMKVVYGMNLPAVIEALGGRDQMTIERLSEKVVKAARENCGIGKY